MTRQIMNRHFSKAFFRCFLGAAFIAAGSLKLSQGISSGGDRRSLYDVLVGGNYALHVAFCLGEIVLRSWVVSGYRFRIAGVLVLILLSAFSGLLVRELQQDSPKSCGCFLSASSSDEDASSAKRRLLLSLTFNVALGAGVVSALPGKGLREQTR